MPRKRKRHFLKLDQEDIETSADDARDELLGHIALVFGHLIFLASVLLVISPVLAFIFDFNDLAGILTLVVVLTSPATLSALRQYREFSFEKCWHSILFLCNNRTFMIIVALLLNFILFLRIGIQTLIQPLLLVGIYLLGAFLPFMFLRKQKIKRRSVNSILLSLFLVNLLLAINYFPSRYPVTETYMIHWNWQTVKGMTNTGTKHRSSFINLSDHAYDQYPGIRIFWDFDKISHCRKVIYTFETGLFGIRVLKKYAFI